ncbi:MAG: arsenosugar biosynthesis radical SAM (seleno)protein ArsS [Myxococcota bacterium]|nr:arsenosugar biosynthesis radical SAM (seleno)protein ArsS [Myxococcota bacterium]
MEPATAPLNILAAPADCSFETRLHSEGLTPLRAEELSWLQINVGKLCNQACHHCHVDAGPLRTEQMSAATADRIIELMDSRAALELVDITGGAPELNPNFRRLVLAARQRGLRVIDRCNLTVLFEPGQEDLSAFLAREGVEIVASLPCYLEATVDGQRGRGVFDKSIRGLQALNALGYGQDDGRLPLTLVYNPTGPFLPPVQAELEQVYKEQLAASFGIHFHSLITITNMPIRRFLQDLEREGAATEYRDLLQRSFNPATVEGLMCRSLVSVGWDGQLYDCDFNQMLNLELDGACAKTIWDIEDLAELSQRSIRTAAHCFGCTAGDGSGCGGSIS